MPVTRARINVSPQIGTNPVTARPTNAAAVMQQQSKQFGQMAVEYGRTMALAAEDEAKALIRGAVFSTGPNGLPQMPPNPTERMGTIARETYDAGMIEAMAHRMTTAMQAQIKEAEASNLYDYDAFQADAADRLAAMAQDVPPGMEGMFQQISQGLIVDAGGSIGMRQGQQAIRLEATNFPHQIQQINDNMNSAILMGQSERATMILEDAIAYIDSRPDSVVPDKVAAKNEVFAQHGFARMMQDLDLRNAPPDVLNELIERFNNSDPGAVPDELMDYARTGGEGSAPNGAVAAMIANRLNILRSDAYDAENKRIAANKSAAMVNETLSGNAGKSAENERALDAGLSIRHQFVDEEGNARPINAMDWLASDDKTRHAMVRQVKTTGFYSQSLKSTFNGLNNRMDTDELVAGYSLYRDLKEVPNLQGNARSMTGDMPDRLLQIYGLADALGGDTEEAVRLIKAVEVNGEDWTDRHLQKAMGSRREDTAQEDMRRFVNDTVFDDVDALQVEKDQAQEAFQMYLRTGMSKEEAGEATRQIFDGRYVESDYTAHGMRTAYAPEQHYADPAVTTLFGEGGFLSELGRSSDAKALKAAEAVAGRMLWPFSSLPDDLRPDFGGDRLGATRFQILADSGIRQLIADTMDPMQREAFMTSRDMFMPGERDGQYTLIPRRDSGGMPVYEVMLYGPNGMKQPIGTLDVREKWSEMMETELTITQLDKRIQQNEQMLDFLFSGSDEGNEAWEKIADGIIEGEDFEYRELMKEYFGERYK